MNTFTIVSLTIAIAMLVLVSTFSLLIEKADIQNRKADKRKYESRQAGAAIVGCLSAMLAGITFWGDQMGPFSGLVSLFLYFIAIIVVVCIAVWIAEFRWKLWIKKAS